MPGAMRFGKKIKKFWTKYIYNGLGDLYNKSKGFISGAEYEPNELPSNEEYPDFDNDQNPEDLMKNLPPPDAEFNAARVFSEDDEFVNEGFQRLLC